MMMLNMKNWERKKYVLECISPVHIGNGETYKPFEYYFDARKKEVYFLDPVKWAHFLVQQKLLDEYANEVEKGSLRLQFWLKTKFPAQMPDRLLAGISYAKSSVLIFDNHRKTSVNDIACQLKTPGLVPYIPGSSIKGAIHSAILWHLIKKDPQKFQDLWGPIARALQDKRNYSHMQVAQDLEKRTLMILNRVQGKGKEALNSVMQGIQISDAHQVNQSKQTILIQKLDASYKKSSQNGYGNVEKEGHGISLFRECIPYGTKLEFTMKLDTDITNAIGLTSLDTLWKWVREYIQAGIRMQKKVFGQDFAAEIAEAQEADLLLGGGTGFLSKTVYYALAPDQQEGGKALARYFDMIFRRKGMPAHHHERDDLGLTPRTLKLARASHYRWLLGLCSVREV